MSQAHVVTTENHSARMEFDYRAALHLLENDRRWPAKVFSTGKASAISKVLAGWHGLFFKPVYQISTISEHFNVCGLAAPDFALSYRIKRETDTQITVRAIGEVVLFLEVVSHSGILPGISFSLYSLSFGWRHLREKILSDSQKNLAGFCHYLKNAEQKEKTILLKNQAH